MVHSELDGPAGLRTQNQENFNAQHPLDGFFLLALRFCFSVSTEGSWNPLQILCVVEQLFGEDHMTHHDVSEATDVKLWEGVLPACFLPGSRCCGWLG